MEYSRLEGTHKNYWVSPEANESYEINATQNWYFGFPPLNGQKNLQYIWDWGGKKAKRDCGKCGQILNKTCPRQLQTLYFWTRQPYTVSLCHPSVLYWGNTDFCLIFCAVLLFGWFSHSIAQRSFQSSSSFTHVNWVPNTEYFTSFIQLRYVNIYFHSPICCTQWQSFKGMSKGWIIML